MGIVEGITAAKATIDVTRTVLDLLNRPNINRDDVRRKISQLLDHAVNTQMALADARQEIGDLQQKLDDREAFKALDADMGEKTCPCQWKSVNSLPTPGVGFKIATT